MNKTFQVIFILLSCSVMSCASLDSARLTNLSANFYAQGRLNDALAAADKAIEIKPDNVDAWNNKGVALYGLGLYGEAAKAYKKAVDLRPTYALAWTNLSACLGQLGQNEEALKANDKVIEIEPTLVEAWINRSAILFDLKRSDEALKASDKAIELKPGNTSFAWYSRSANLAKHGRNDEAIEAADMALQTKSNYVNAWYIKARLYAIKNDKENSIKSFSKAIEFSSIKEVIKANAMKDEAFMKFKDDPEFKKLID